jgi:lipopolysaccharide/colanic/teichoic acid biosynthesis glycosyltransferase
MASRRTRFAKAYFDRALSAIGLLMASPIIVICAVAIWVDDPGPVFFRQIRVGRNARPFRLVKLRSMRVTQSGTPITSSHDPRITRVGRFLRAYKLDELPQLWNVLRGDMSFVGPRPEVPQFVDAASPEWRVLLSVKPGITDLATLIYRNEEKLLFDQSDPQKYYREVALPAKMALSISFIRSAGFWLECKLIAYTVYYTVFPRRFDDREVARAFEAASRGAGAGPAAPRTALAERSGDS